MQIVVEHRGRRGSARIITTDDLPSRDAAQKARKLIARFGTPERAFSYALEHRNGHPKQEECGKPNHSWNHWEAVCGILRRIKAGKKDGDRRPGHGARASAMCGPF